MIENAPILNHWPDFFLGVATGFALTMMFVKRPTWNRKVGGKQKSFYMGIVSLVISAVSLLRFCLTGSELGLAQGAVFLAAGTAWLRLYHQAPEPEIPSLDIKTGQH
jgi:uncharacterized membrane protein HdeD (DUF308 family)